MRKKNISGTVHILVLICFLSARTQSQTDSIQPEKRFLLTGLPVVFYTPETRFGFGATGLCLFNFRSDTANSARSSISLGMVYTQNKQVLLSLPYNLFLQNRHYMLYGEIAYNRFSYNFYGVGNSVDKDFVEKYGVSFPRVRVTFLKKLRKYFYAGLRYAFDEFSLFNLDSSGLLIRGHIPGSMGGRVSGFGGVAVFDRRDNVFFPTSGIWSEFVVYRDDKLSGSSFNYTRIAFDFSHYIHLRKNIFAWNFYTMYSPDDLPFFQMPLLGGQKKMRGFYEGRYRDNNALILQAEYRRMVWGPLGFAIFADVGQVARKYGNYHFSNWKYTYGAGLRLRFDEKQKLNLRFDVGVGNGSPLSYFTVGEAF